MESGLSKLGVNDMKFNQWTLDINVQTMKFYPYSNNVYNNICYFFNCALHYVLCTVVDNIGRDQFCSSRQGLAGSFIFNISKILICLSLGASVFFPHSLFGRIKFQNVLRWSSEIL